MDFFTELPESIWNQLPRPRHRVVFAEGEHWDYLGPVDVPCRPGRGPCHGLGAATDDLVTMFLAKYLPPELATDLPDRVPPSMEPPEMVLTPEQEFFAGAHLVGFDALEGDTACALQVSFELRRWSRTDVRTRRTRSTSRVRGCISSALAIASSSANARPATSGVTSASLSGLTAEARNGI